MPEENIHKSESAPEINVTCPAHSSLPASAISSCPITGGRSSQPENRVPAETAWGGTGGGGGCRMRQHGSHPHDVVPPRSKYFDSGRFGRIFGELPPFSSDTPQVRRDLLDLGKKDGIMDAKDDLSKGPKLLITDSNLQTGNPNNPRMSAGMTFLGQFLDHDMTFDPTSSLERQADPEHIANFRTPTLALDNIYGAGPGGSPHLYDQPGGIKFYIEPVGNPGTPARYDVPRNLQGTALLGDPRNDENLIVSQLHLAFLRFHNAVIDHLIPSLGVTLRPEDLFLEAQRIVRWHYQWIIVHEFLPLTCTQEVVDDILTNGRKFYDWRKEPFIPVEFSVACYRFGHSQVRPSYRTNFESGTPPADDPSNSQLFQFIFTPVSDHTNAMVDDLSGSVRKTWRFIDWRTFFDFGDGNVRSNKRIDPVLSSPLFALPISVVPNPDDRVNPNSLAQRNLLRHLTFSLPSGQRVAKTMKAKIPSIQTLRDSDLSELEQYGLHNRTPLWYYILKEAAVLADGKHLGPVGGRIVAEVFIGLLQGDSQSYLHQDPDWTPFLDTIDPDRKGGDFRMIDLLRFAGVA